MRWLLLWLLVGCVDLSYVDQEEADKCDRGYDFVWTELDGGTCGSFGTVVDDMTQCPVTLASECLDSNEVKCGDDTRWMWRKSDAGTEHVTGQRCESRYALKRR